MTTLAPNPKPQSKFEGQNQLETMAMLSTLLNSSLESDSVRQTAIDAARTLVNCEASSLLFLNPKTGGLYFDIAIGDQGARVKTIELEKGQGVAGWVAENRKPIVIKDAQNDPRLFRGADKQSGFITRNMLCVPVATRNKFIGVLQALNKRERTFDQTDARLLTALASQIAVALENAQLYESLKESLYSVVHVLVDTIEKRDSFAAGHAKRVSKYCMAIGKELGLNKNQLVNLKLASLLHDVGMVSLPDDQLRRRAKNGFEEERIIKKHIQLGVEILSSVPHMRPILPIIKHHHEAFDGSGPFRVAGDKIPLLSRIIAVADTFDAMTNDRPYHLCKGYDSAVVELGNQAGKKLDPHIVKAFVNSKSIKLAKRFFNR